MELHDKDKPCDEQKCIEENASLLDKVYTLIISREGSSRQYTQEEINELYERHKERIKSHEVSPFFNLVEQDPCDEQDLCDKIESPLSTPKTWGCYIL